MLKTIRPLWMALLLALCALPAVGQERKVENRPYTDLRPFHFGILVGTHLQDMEMVNVGPQTITAEDGTQSEVLISADQDRWDAGLNVGVLGEFRLNSTFQLRVAPALYFGTRRLTFRNHSQTDDGGHALVRHQDLKSIYVSSAVDLICAAPRFNNHRPYLMAGINPMINTLIPMEYEHAGRVGLVAGLVDCFIYLGSALAGTAAGALSDGYGWGAVYAVWALVSALGAALAFVSIRGGKRMAKL